MPIPQLLLRWMYLPKKSLEDLRQRIDLVEVLSEHVDIKRAGSTYKALCPFHDEKTPSFVVQRGNSHYHCFGCGAHGDAIEFLMTYLKMSFMDAVESLADKFRITLDKVAGKGEKKGPGKKALKEALGLAARFFHFLLLHTEEGHKALKYLYDRNLGLEFIRQFQLGIAPKEPGLLRKFLHKYRVSDAVMELAGLIAPSRHGGWRDFFFDRITFPVQDATGAVIGFSARKFKEETFGGKYVNTTETPLFKKSKILFGLNYCRRRIAKERRAIIVEGQVDALRLIHAGFTMSVAGQGTAFGEGHVKELLNLGVNTVYLALDGDKAGQEAAQKIGHIFQKVGVEVYVVALPWEGDPDTILTEQGPEGFAKLLGSGSDYLSFLVDSLSHEYNLRSPAGKSEFVQTIAGKIREWDNPVMVHESLRRLARLTNIPEDFIGLSQQNTPNLYLKRAAVAGMTSVDPDRVLEADLLRWLLVMGREKSSFVGLVEEKFEAR